MQYLDTDRSNCRTFLVGGCRCRLDVLTLITLTCLPQRHTGISFMRSPTVLQDKRAKISMDLASRFSCAIK